MADAALWVRFERDGAECFGRLAGDEVEIFDGDMFAGARPTGGRVALAEVVLTAPCRPSKIIALWKNSKALAAKLNQTPPDEPLYLMKAPSSLAGPDAVIRRPASYDGRVVFEGELAVVVGRRCKNASAEEAEAALFGLTCTNDVTAADIIDRDPSFAQWARAKSFDGFGAIGPAIACGLDPDALTIRTMLNGSERQNYPATDLFFSPVELVRLISHDMTLEPGDVICCGTSVGVGTMKEASNAVEVAIDGIGVLRNSFVQDPGGAL